MDRPKSGSPEPRPDSKTEQSTDSAKPEKPKSFNVIRAEVEAAEKQKENPSKQGDTSSGKGPKNTEESSRKRSRNDTKAETTASPDDTASEDDGPSKKKKRLDELESDHWYAQKNFSESLIKKYHNNAEEAWQELKDTKNDVLAWDQDIKELIESDIPAARKSAESRMPENIGLNTTRDLEMIQETLKEAKEQLHEGFKGTISRKEAKKAHKSIKELIEAPVPETLEGFQEFDKAIKEATKIKVDHCNQRAALYEKYRLVQLEQIKKLNMIQNFYEKNDQKTNSNDNDFMRGEREWEDPASPGEEPQDIAHQK